MASWVTCSGADQHTPVQVLTQTLAISAGAGIIPWRLRATGRCGSGANKTITGRWATAAG